MGIPDLSYDFGHPPEVLATIAAIMFVAALVRSTVGFGDALVAMPLLAMVIGVRAATPLMALIGSSIALLVVVGSWREIRFAPGLRLVAGSMLGIPIGLVVLRFAPEGIVTGLLGVFLAAFGAWSLLAPRVRAPVGRPWAYLFGLASGALGSAYSVSGPPIVMYGALSRWAPADFRATIQSVLLPSGAMVLLGHALTGLWSRDLFLLYGASLPLVFAATLAGAWLNRMIPAERFVRLVHGALILLGLALLL